MTKFYTVTGKSKEKPSGLPEGFEVEETEEPFRRSVSADGSTCCTVRVEGDLDGVLIALMYNDRPAAGSAFAFTRGGVVGLRDALTEWLGDEPKAPAVVNVGDPEPPRDRTYIDKDGDVWRHDGEGWYFDEGRYTWSEIIALTGFSSYFPWTLKTDLTSNG